MGPQLPLGYRFKPTDKELVTNFLRKKASGQALPHHLNVILDLDLYGNLKPWEIFDRGNHPEGEFYVFTKIKKKYNGGGGNVMIRQVRDGTWKADNITEVFDDDGTIIGFKRSLNFFDPFVVKEKKIDDDGDKKSKNKKMKKTGRTKWIMHEYTLNNYEASSSSSSDNRREIPAMCRIKRGMTPIIDNKDGSYTSSDAGTGGASTSSCNDPCCSSSSSSSSQKKRPLEDDDHRHQLRNSKRLKETTYDGLSSPTSTTAITGFEENVYSSSVSCASDFDVQLQSQPSTCDQFPVEDSHQGYLPEDLMGLINFDTFEDVDIDSLIF